MSSTLKTALQFSKIGLSTFAISKFNKEAGKRHLLRELGSLPGIPAKMGQILTMRFGPETDSESHSPAPLPIETIKSIIDSEAPQLAECLESLQPLGITASLGQVHEGTLINGKRVAIKIRYPGVDQDLKKQLKIILGTMKALPAPDVIQLDYDDYQSFLNEFFLEEVDYIKEARSQQKFHHAWSGDFRFVIPEIQDGLSTPSVLVQSFEPSTPLHRIQDLSRKEKNHYSEALRDFFLTGALDFGLIHTDLHPKNWGIRREMAQIVFYDFGATIQLSPELTLALKSLSIMKSDDPEHYLKLLQDLGFNRRKLIPIRHHLQALIALLFEPVRNQEWKPSGWKLQDRINELLGDNKWNFRTAGPPWFLMLIRGLNGWLNGMKLLESDPIPEGPSVSTKLKVRVIENGLEKIFLELPAPSVMDLEMLMPSKVTASIREQGIPIKSICEAAIRNGYQPQTLFELQAKENHYKVWIE
jgi:predicted unusual protein kinase regulating ubiquinone biosynthesis (AarF/ABC1/UbiB family)